MAIDIGRIAYQAYMGNDENIKVYDVRDGFLWEDLTKEEQDAWRKAACAVWDYLADCQEEMDNDPIVGMQVVSPEGLPVKETVVTLSKQASQSLEICGQIPPCSQKK
jgi:hypothetical protein